MKIFLKGDSIEINFYDYDIEEYVRKVFKDAEREVFLFRVESVIMQFKEGIEFDNDSGTEYIVNLTPIIWWKVINIKILLPW